MKVTKFYYNFMVLFSPPKTFPLYRRFFMFFRFIGYKKQGKKEFAFETFYGVLCSSFEHFYDSFYFRPQFIFKGSSLTVMHHILVANLISNFLFALQYFRHINLSLYRVKSLFFNKLTF